MYFYGPPKPTCLEFFIVNNLVFSWLKASIFHGFGGSWYFKDHLDRELLPFIAAFVGPSLPPWVGRRIPGMSLAEQIRRAAVMAESEAIQTAVVQGVGQIPPVKL